LEGDYFGFSSTSFRSYSNGVIFPVSYFSDFWTSENTEVDREALDSLGKGASLLALLALLGKIVTLGLFSDDGEYFFEKVLFFHRGHFNVVFLLNLRSDFAPVDFEFNCDIFRDILDNFDRNGHVCVRLDKAIAGIH
jgi:hypothetical protein